MRGDHLHNRVLIGQLERMLRRSGARTQCEAPTRTSAGTGFIDLLAQRDGLCLAVEAELTARRIPNDVAKAAACGADELWILVPNARASEAVRRALDRRVSNISVLAVRVLTLGQAKHRIAQHFPATQPDRTGSVEQKG